MTNVGLFIVYDLMAESFYLQYEGYRYIIFMYVRLMFVYDKFQYLLFINPYFIYAQSEKM